MIPSEEDLRRISRLREGNLEEIPFSVLLHALSFHQRTVLVELRRRQIVKTVFFEYGVVVDCRSNLLHETLSRFLVSRERISEEVHDAAVELSLKRGVPLGEVLIEQGTLDASELFKFLQQNLAKKLLDLFSWRDAGFKMLFDVPEFDSTLKVKVPQLIVTGISSYSNQQEADAAIAPLVGRKLMLHPAPPIPLEELRLTPTQTKLADALKPGRRIDELAGITEIPVDEISRILYALCLIGVVGPADKIGPLRPSGIVTTVMPVLVSEPKTPILPRPDLDQLRNELMENFLAYRRRDAFEILDLLEEEPESRLEEKFLAYAQRYSPWTFAGEMAPLAEKARDLFLAGARAYATLHDREQREALLSRRRTLKEDVYKKPVHNPFAIKTDLLNPELQFRKARELMVSRKYREAITFLEFASDCDPQNGAYRAELAYCRYLENPQLPSAPLKELDEALRLDLSCGIAAYYAGEIHRQAGRRDDAERYLRKAFKLLPRDPRPGEALSAVAKMKKK